MILYKYLSPERIDVLETRLIAYPHPRVFNDPFEARPLFPADAPEAIALFEEARPRRGSFTSEEESALRSQIDAIQQVHGVARLRLEHIAQNVGVLSLSEKRDCPLMWAHYTEQHSGFVIGFDTAHPDWVKLGQLHGPQGEPAKVRYSANRPKPKAIDDVARDHIWYTKSKDWEYEKEWRVTRWIGRAVKTVSTLRGKIPLHEFPAEAVHEVILGERADEGLEFRILDLVTRSPYKDVAVSRVELDRKEFRFNIVP